MIGTSSSITNKRIVCSPPADIFVLGLHPETIPDDIVKDLAEKDTNQRSMSDPSLDSQILGISVNTDGSSYSGVAVLTNPKSSVKVKVKS